MSCPCLQFNMEVWQYILRINWIKPYPVVSAKCLSTVSQYSVQYYYLSQLKLLKSDSEHNLTLNISSIFKITRTGYFTLNTWLFSLFSNLVNVSINRGGTLSYSGRVFHIINNLGNSLWNTSGTLSPSINQCGTPLASSRRGHITKSMREWCNPE